MGDIVPEKYQLYFAIYIRIDARKEDNSRSIFDTITKMYAAV